MRRARWPPSERAIDEAPRYDRQERHDQADVAQVQVLQDRRRHARDGERGQTRRPRDRHDRAHRDEHRQPDDQGRPARRRRSTAAERQHQHDRYRRVKVEVEGTRLERASLSVQPAGASGADQPQHRVVVGAEVICPGGRPIYAGSARMSSRKTAAAHAVARKAAPPTHQRQPPDSDGGSDERRARASMVGTQVSRLVRHRPDDKRPISNERHSGGPCSGSSTCYYRRRARPVGRRTAPCAKCERLIGRRLAEAAGAPIGLATAMPAGLVQLEWCASFGGPAGPACTPSSTTVSGVSPRRSDG